MDFWAQKIYFNAVGWYRDDLSIVFTKLGYPKEEGASALHNKTKR